MKRILLRAWAGVFIFACVLGLALSRHSALLPATAGTPTPLPSASAVPTPASTTAPNTNITNAASATYSDGSNTYTILSNTVTVVVQNAPSLVILTTNGTAAGNVSGQIYPGDYLTEYYTLVNTGNGTGNFVLATAAQASPTPLPAGNAGSGVSGPVLASTVTYDVSCSAGATLNAVETTLSAVNTDLQNAACQVAAGGAVNMAVTFETNTTTVTPTTTSDLEGQITYSAVGSAAAASSLWANNSYSESVVSDMRVDVQKSPAPIATDGTETYTVTVHNAGYGSANFINSYGTTCVASSVIVCGPALSGPGMLISDKVPLNAQNTPLPVVTIVPSPGPRPTPALQTETVVYTTDATATNGWSTPNPTGTFPPTTRFVGLFLSGPGTTALYGDPTPATTSQPGNVPAAASQVGFSVTLGPIPGGLNVGNYIVAPAGDNKTTPCIEGPGLVTTATACDSNGGNPSPGSTPGDPRIPLATSTPSTPGPGLSNLTTLVTPSLFNGPFGAPAAQGCFNTKTTPAPFPSLSPNPYPTLAPTTYPTCSSGTGANTNMDDYTQAVMTPAPSSSPAYGASPAAGSALSTTIQNTAQNPNTSGTPVPVQLAFPTLPSNVSITSVVYGGGANCAGGTTTTLSGGYYALGTIAANSTLNYCVTYTTSTGSGAPRFFQPLFADLRVSSVAAPAQYYNDTWNVLMPGGFMEIVKQANVLTIGGNPGSCTGTIGGALPTPPANPGVCPGGVIQYAIAYVNTLPATTSGASPAPSEPPSANVSLSGNFTITEDGSANGSNWGTYTNGLYDPATTPPASVLQPSMTYATMLSNCGKVTLSCGDSAGASFTGNSVGSTHFTDVVPNAAISPQSVGELVFAVKVH